MTTEQKDMLEALVDGVIVLQGDKIIFSNDTACKMLGYRASELLGLPIKILFPTKFQYKSFEKIIGEDSVKYLECELYNKDKVTISANLSVSIYNPSNKPIYDIQDALKIILIRNIKVIEQARQTGITQFKIYAKDQFSIALGKLESRMRGPVIEYFEPLPFESKLDAENFLIRLTVFYFTTISGGSDGARSRGLFGPLPVTGKVNYNSLVYTSFLKNPNHPDPNEANDYYILLIIYPKYLDRLFIDRDRNILKNDLKEYFQQIEYSKNLTEKCLPQIKDLIIFGKDPEKSQRERLLERKLAAITELSSDINVLMDIDTVFSVFNEFMEKILGYEKFAFLLSSRYTKNLQVEAYCGYPAEIEKLLIPIKTTQAKWLQSKFPSLIKCCNIKEILIKSNESIDPGIRQLDGDAQQQLVVPILKNDTLFGIILVTATDSSLGNSDERILLAFANQISGYLSNRSYELKLREIYDLNQVLPNAESLNEIYTIVCSFVRDVLDWPLFTINEISRKFKKIRITTCYTESESFPMHKEVDLDGKKGIARYVALTGEEAIVQDISTDDRYVEFDTRVKAQISIPIKAEEKVLGVLNVCKYARHSFSQDDIGLLRALAKLLAVYMFQKKLEKITVNLFNLTAKITANNSLPQVLEEIVQIVVKTLDYEFFSISLVNHETETVHLAAFYGYTSGVKPESEMIRHIEKINLMSPESVVVRAAREGRNIFVSELSDKEPYVLSVNKKMKTELAIPFFSSSGIVLGILNVESEYKNAFNSNDALILEKLGEILAKALEKLPLANPLLFLNHFKQEISDERS